MWPGRLAASRESEAALRAQIAGKDAQLMAAMAESSGQRQLAERLTQQLDIAAGASKNFEAVVSNRDGFGMTRPLSLGLLLKDHNYL